MSVQNKMKLLLASKEKFLLDKGYNSLNIPKDQLKIGAINSGLKPVTDQGYLQYIKEYREEVKLSGISFEEFDIEGKSKDEIIDFFKDKNVIQIIGGNVFYLIRAIRESGFPEILKDLLNRGLFYVSCSSGSYIMCPDLIVGTWRSKNNYDVIDLTGLNYVPFCLKCHYVDEKESEIREKMKTLKYPLRVLKDDQAILIEDGRETFIGGPEIILN